MADYASAPIQPIVQGLITVETVNLIPLTPVFRGKGVSSIARTVGGAAAGDFVLTLDRGLPGNAGELSGPTATAPAAVEARTELRVRGSATNAVPGATTIVGLAISYVTPTAGPGTDGGETQLRVVLTNAAAAALDPILTVGNGCEIVVWKGVS